RLRTSLERLPHEIVEFRERLQVLRLEVVPPEDANLVLRDLRVLLFCGDVSRELVRVLLALLRRRAGTGLLEQVNQVDHSDDRVGGELRVVRIVDAARAVAMRVRDRGRSNTVEAAGQQVQQ